MNDHKYPVGSVLHGISPNNGKHLTVQVTKTHRSKYSSRLKQAAKLMLGMPTIGKRSLIPHLLSRSPLYQVKVFGDGLVLCAEEYLKPIPDEKSAGSFDEVMNKLKSGQPA